MSHSRSFGREMPPHHSSGNALQREREREKKRREQQLITQPETRDEPVFSQPRKVTTSRQDSLTRNINNVLGDPNLACGILLREPQNWYGTSRSSQGPANTAPAQPQDETSVFPNASQRKPSPSQKNYSSSQKRGSSGSYSTGGYGQSQSSRQAPPPPSNSSNQTQRSSSSLSNHGYNKSRDDGGSGRSFANSQTKQPYDNTSSRNRHGQKHSTSSFSSNAKNLKQDQHKAEHQTTFNSSHLPIMQKESLLNMDSHEKTLSGLKVELPARISERDRVSSVDSDMLGVETILKEMAELPLEPLTEIKTPSVSESKFNFLAKRKVVGPESSLESSNTDAVDGIASDSESSEEESTDEEEEEKEKPNKMNWMLSSWTATPQQPSNPLLERVPDNGGRGSKPTLTSVKPKREDQRSRTSGAQDRSRVNISSPANQGTNIANNTSNNENQSSRGRKVNKKKSTPKGSGRTRSSSSSSQRSASSGHRSTSSGKRSASSQHRSTSSQPRTNVPNLNQTDPTMSKSQWSNGGRRNDLSSHKAKTDQHARKQNPGTNTVVQRTSDNGATLSPANSGSNRSSPHDRYRESPVHPYHGSQPARSTPGTSPRGPRSSPHLPSKHSHEDTKASGVSKETLSRTSHVSETRHKVGRKGPSARIHNKVSSYATPDPVKPPVTTSTGISDDSSSDSEISEDESNTTIKNLNQPMASPPTQIQPIAELDSDSASESSSDSESESSSSDSDSDSEVAKVDTKAKVDAQFKTPVSQPNQVSWNLVDLGAKTEQKNIPKRSPKPSRVANEVPPSKLNHSPPFHASLNNNSSTFSQNRDQNNCNPTGPLPKEKSKKAKSQQRPQNEAKKSSRKSAPGALTPNHWGTSKQEVVKTPPSKRPTDPGSNKSPRQHNTCWNNVWTKSTNNSTTVDNINPQKSSNVAKKGRTASTSSDTSHRRRSSPHDGRPSQPSDFTSTVKMSRSPPEIQSAPPPPDFISFPALWVRIKATLVKADSTVPPVTTNRPPYKSPQNSSSKRPITTPDVGSTAPSPPNKSSKLPEERQQQCSTTVSTGSETEQPIRRADNVQVAVADASTDWEAHNSSTSKRKLNSSELLYDESHHSQSLPASNKRRKRDKSSPGSNATSPWQPDHSQRKKTPPNDHWREPASVGGSSERVSINHQSSHPSNPDSYHSNNRTPNARSQPRQESPTSNNPSSQPVLPDSSVPEQERIQTSDWYMREGKRMKREGDRLGNSRLGRTRPGELLSRALAYFEASMFFIMNGYIMEAENIAERSETGSNSGSSSTSHSPTSMYHQTITLLGFIINMKPHVEKEDRAFKRIIISCIRCQAVLHYRMFKLKKEIATKYSDILNDQFKNMSKSNRTPSPWDHNANAAPNVLSPMSPAVPSPFGHPGPSPVSSNGEQVSSSTQAGKMTPPSHGSLVFPQKMYDMYRQHHNIMHNLLQAHVKWDQGEGMLEGHQDFFRNIDTLCSRTLNFHTSLRDVFLYHKVVLHQLRTLTIHSPQE